jgi:hypothetical protein
MREEHKEAVKKRMLEFIDEQLSYYINWHRLPSIPPGIARECSRRLLVWLPSRGCLRIREGLGLVNTCRGSRYQQTLLELFQRGCQLMIFQGPPFEDEDHEEAIAGLWDVMKKYDPTFYGFAWADEDGPRFQMEPLGYRGYIEARPCKRV